jgi:hypothetical protein
LGDAIADEFAEKRIPPSLPGLLQLKIPVVRWVIKDDDLKLIEALTDGFKAGAAAGFLAGQPVKGAVAGGVVGIVAAAVKLGRQIAKKGRRLSRLEYSVIAALNGIDVGLTESQLLTWLVAQSSYTAGEIQGAIKRLEAIALPDGTVTALISRDADGKLRVAGI